VRGIRGLLALVAIVAIAVGCYVLGTRWRPPSPVYLSRLVYHRSSCPVAGADAVPTPAAEAEDLYWPCLVCPPAPGTLSISPDPPDHLCTASPTRLR
jgi:hypothetical protein